jgi:hypothetical protein
MVGQKTEHDAKWQKHVAEGLWIILAFALAICLALLYAESHGYFDAAGGNATAPAWPTSWP